VRRTGIAHHDPPLAATEPRASSAARVAATLRRELGVDVESRRGPDYAEFACS
jgi:hypothetical protein